jgi:hypothetical protein
MIAFQSYTMLRIWNPGAYHGRGKKNFFEGWYFKMVDRSEANAYAVIPGVSLAGANSHAFIMFLDARAHKLRYFSYPLEEMYADENKFELAIGKSTFSLAAMHLDMGSREDRVVARADHMGPYPWPVRLLSPGAMGWYAFVPGMECYHGILSMDHAIDGYVETAGGHIDLTGGRGYIEKDWGASMPSSWIWVQTNHFDMAGVSLSGSIAKIPWRGNYFTGFIFGFLYDKKLYEFTTYSGAHIVGLQADDDNIRLRLENKQYRLDIDAARAGGVELPAPKLGDMTAKVNESLNSRIGVALSRKKGTGVEPVFTGTGRNAGLELVGDVAQLLPGLRR